MNVKTNLKPKMIEALKKSYGNVSSSADAVGIAPKTHYEWMKDDAEYREEVEAIKERAIDHVESKLMERIDEGDTTATLFYLKTQGRKRGYVETERKEINGKMDIDANVDVSKLPKDMLRNVADKLQGIDD